MNDIDLIFLKTAIWVLPILILIAICVWYREVREIRRKEKERKLLTESLDRMKRRQGD